MTLTRPRGLVLSWYYAPYCGSADVDFFHRTKNLDADLAVVQVARTLRDDRMLAFPHRAGIQRHELLLDHERPRTRETRKGFVRGALDLFRRLGSRFDFVLSHSNEVHSHRAALEIRALRRIPWLAYFGDPSERNPYARALEHYPFYDEDNDTERRTLEEADLLVFNNEYQRLLMLRGREHLRPKSRVVPHAYDPTWYPPTAPRAPGPVRLGHFGTLYHHRRRGDVLFRAVDRLLTVYPAYRHRFVVELYGTLEQVDRDAHRSMRFPEHVELKGRVGYLESLELMKQMDVLVLIDAFFEPAKDDGLDFNPFLPCKFTDYLGAQKPILGITMRRGVPGEVLVASSQPIADERPDRIAYLLKRHLDRTIEVDPRPYAAFELSRQNAAMQGALDDLLARAR